MNIENLSGLRLYSLGIVFKAKERNSDIVKVWPVEHLSLVKGETGENHREMRSEIQNREGIVKNAKVQVGEVIEAKWIPDGHSNRETPPDVQPNETIKIYRYADTNDFYWTTLFREPELRRLETVRYVYSNLPSGIKAYDENTSYWLEFSTHDKRIRLHTSENDGEACTYDFEFNTRAGTFSLQDNLGNSIVLDSPNGILTATTENEVIVNTKRYIVNASESIEFNSPKMTRNVDVIEENGDKLTANTKVYLTEGFNVTGNSANPGGEAGVIQGNVEVEGNVHATGTIIDDAGNTNHHSH